VSEFDVIVAGAGGVGSSALLRLAKYGVKAVALDPYQAGHNHGSSHGQTRIIREAYFEHPDYVPLVKTSYRMWEQLERESNEQLLLRCGLIEAGPPDGKVAPGVLQSAKQHDLQVDLLTQPQQQFPQFQFTPGDTVLLERQAGILLVEKCVRTQIAQAVKLGAEHHTGVRLLSWQPTPGGVRVQTTQGELTAARLVIAAGAWSSQLLRGVAPLTVVRKHVYWQTVTDPWRYDNATGAACPLFFFETAGGCFYGIPQVDNRGMKLASHGAGETVADPTFLNRNDNPAERQRVQQFAARHLKLPEFRPQSHAVCMYTMTPDEHFIVDYHPQHPAVVIAAGLSGHGFKFAPALGDLVARLALNKPVTQHKLFSATRFTP